MAPPLTLLQVIAFDESVRRSVRALPTMEQCGGASSWTGLAECSENAPPRRVQKI